MDIEVVEISDDRSWHEWYEATLAVQLEAWPGDPQLGEAELRTLHRDNEYVGRVHLLARAGGNVVGSAELELSKRDNLNVADLAVSVPLAHRGHGYGRKLLDAAEQVAAEHDRTVLVASTFGRLATAESPSARFAHAAGYRVARHEVRRDLSLPLEAGRLDTLHSDNAPFASDYELVGWWNSCPDHLIEGRVRLAGTLSDDEPRGELAMESQVWDEVRMREWESSRVALGRALSCMGAVERRSSELVAVTEIGMPLSGEDLARQYTTVVAPQHRGHRLGILTKIANLRQAATRAGGPWRITTWNAESNRDMVRVNAELGFEIIGHALNWQKVLSP